MVHNGLPRRLRTAHEALGGELDTSGGSAQPASAERMRSAYAAISPSA